MLALPIPAELESPSPRRAWIEMHKEYDMTKLEIVALPTEGVD